jgi:hypothetical protein
LVSLLCLFTALGFNQAYAQATANWQWAVTTAQNNNTCIETDVAGNVYSAGIALTKYSPSGALIWNMPLANQSQYIFVQDMASDAAGNLYLTGYFYYTAVFDTITLTSAGHADIFVAKFNSHGRVQWARRAGGVGPPPMPPNPGYIDDSGNNIAVDSVGNCYISGLFHTNYNVSVNFDSITIPPNNGRAFVAKYSTNGKIKWVQPVFNAEDYKITLGRNGSYFICKTGGWIIELSKFDNNNNLLWTKSSSQNSFIGVGGRFCTDDIGNCYITGEFIGNLTFGSHTLSAPGSNNAIYLVKYDGNGNVLWAKQSTGGNVYSGSVETDATGAVYLVGSKEGSPTFGPGVQLTGSYGLMDVFTVKYDTAGNALWGASAGSSSFDYGEAISVGPTGNCIIAGTYKNSCTFGQYVLQAPNTTNYFIAKLAANPTGVKGNKENGRLQLFPNPAASEVTLKGENFRKGTITISDLSGRKVYEAQLQPEVKISTIRWPAGVYAVILTSEGKIYTQKLVITH